MLELWTIRCYISPSRRDMIADWHERQSDEVQAAVKAVLEFLVQRPRTEWRRKMSGIGEIRFKVVNKQYRIFGFFGPDQSDFTLLIGASKKGNTYDPRSAPKTALNRMTEVKADGSRSRVCDF